MSSYKFPFSLSAPLFLSTSFSYCLPTSPVSVFYSFYITPLPFPLSLLLIVCFVSPFLFNKAVSTSVKTPVVPPSISHPTTLATSTAVVPTACGATFSQGPLISDSSPDQSALPVPLQHGQLVFPTSGVLTLEKPPCQVNVCLWLMMRVYEL